jgi:hypothetical protein
VYYVLAYRDKFHIGVYPEDSINTASEEDTMDASFIEERVHAFVHYVANGLFDQAELELQYVFGDMTVSVTTRD